MTPLWVIVNLVALIMADSVHADCQSDIRPLLKELSAKIKILDKTQPKDGVGEMVNIGSCASRLRKLYGNFLCCRTFANTAPYWEEISCLQLKKEYLQKACECGSRGMSFSVDEALQDQTLEAFAAIRKLDRAARALGIQNKVVRELVESAASIRNCFSVQTLEILRATEQAILKISGDLGQ